MCVIDVFLFLIIVYSAIQVWHIFYIIYLPQTASLHSLPNYLVIYNWYFLFMDPLCAAMHLDVSKYLRGVSLSLFEIVSEVFLALCPENTFSFFSKFRTI